MFLFPLGGKDFTFGFIIAISRLHVNQKYFILKSQNRHLGTSEKSRYDDFVLAFCRQVDYNQTRSCLYSFNRKQMIMEDWT